MAAVSGEEGRKIWQLWGGALSQGSFRLPGLVWGGVGREKEKQQRRPEAGRMHWRRAEGPRADEFRQPVLVGSASSALESRATSCSSSAPTSSFSTASTMGITMAVVDVLDSHMDSSVVQLMKQSSSLEGRAGRAEQWRRQQGQRHPAHGALPGASRKPRGAGLSAVPVFIQQARFLCLTVSFVLPGLRTE